MNNQIAPIVGNNVSQDDVVSKGLTINDGSLTSLASLETQPTLHYNSNLTHSQSIEYSYDLDKIAPTYNPLFNGVYSFESAEQYTNTRVPDGTVKDESTSSSSDQKGTTTVVDCDVKNAVDKDSSCNVNQNDQVDDKTLVPDSSTTTALPTPLQSPGVLPTPQQSPGVLPTSQQSPGVLPTDVDYNKPIYCPDGLIPPKNKVVAVNPVILVDKVERSLIVQWYENSVKREQRISYKKYGNAKAQQRAEGLISKLMAGSTFDQLYPEKGPPILTIFENAGKYMVSLTRDRTMREWRVDWLNSNGSKMRARWSCKKVGNEEARKRAEAFAYSMMQGTFNPRLLHKATGTRLSKNDMKYNAVVNGVDSSSLQSMIVNDGQQINNVAENNWQCVEGTQKRTTRRRNTNKDGNEKKTTRKRKSNNNNNTTSNSNNNNMVSMGIINNTNNGQHQNTLNDTRYMVTSRNYPYMNICHDGSYNNPYYPMYTEDCNDPSNQNYRNQSMIQQNWLDWNNNTITKMPGYNTEWDYCNNPIDFQYFTQSSHGGNGIPSQNTITSSNEWIAPNYMYMQHDLSTSKDDINSNDTSRLSNQYYGYYPAEQGFYDNISQEQMNLMTPYYDYSNTMRMDSISSPPMTQWNESMQQGMNNIITKDDNEDNKDDICKVVPMTLANYPNILSKPLDANGNPIDVNDHNHSISTGIYSNEHYNYINNELGEVNEEQKISMHQFIIITTITKM